MVIAIQDRFELVDARDWPKQRDNVRQEVWKKVVDEVKGQENYDGWVKQRKTSKVVEDAITTMV